MKQPYFLGISGGSASGKTFLLNELLSRFDAGELTLISQDNYYRKKEEQKRDSEGEINFDHPDAVRLDTLREDIQRLKRGESVSLLEYTFNNPAKTPERITYHPTPVIIVEGLFVFYDTGLSAEFDLKVFVDADEHIKLSRRIKRDYEERGYDLEEVLSRYERHVIPMYKKYVQPGREECDLIIPNNFHIEKACDVIEDHLRARLK